VQEQILIGQQSLLKVSLTSKNVGSQHQDGFITAGMGGGGYGSCSVIAQLAKEREILTVGIVTLPFL
jgi:cell division protein FtsZ